MNELDAQVKSAVAGMVTNAAAVIRDDIVSVLEEGLQLADPTLVGSQVGPVIPLKQSTIDRKMAGGFAYPERARVRTQAMQNAIQAAPGGELQVKIGVWGAEEVAVKQQEGFTHTKDSGATSGGFVPARPFFGITARAKEQIESDCRQSVEQFVQGANATLRMEASIA